MIAFSTAAVYCCGNNANGQLGNPNLGAALVFGSSMVLMTMASVDGMSSKPKPMPFETHHDISESTHIHV